jgi:hypothetical protein
MSRAEAISRVGQHFHAGDFLIEAAGGVHHLPAQGDFGQRDRARESATEALRRG